MRDTTWNRIFLLGYLTRGVFLRYRGDGAPVAEMGVSVSQTYGESSDGRDGGSGDDGYLEVVLPGPEAWRFSKLAGKGSAVFVEGSLRFGARRPSCGGGPRLPVLVAKRVSLLDTAVPPRPEADEAPDLGLGLGLDLGALLSPRRRLPGPEKPAPRARSPDRGVRVAAGTSGDLFDRFG